MILPRIDAQGRFIDSKPPQPSFEGELESVLEDLDAWYLHTPHHLMTTKDAAFKTLLAAHQDSVREAQIEELEHWLRMVTWPNNYLSMQEDMKDRIAELRAGLEKA